MAVDRGLRGCDPDGEKDMHDHYLLVEDNDEGDDESNDNRINNNNMISNDANNSDSSTNIYNDDTISNNDSAISNTHNQLSDDSDNVYAEFITSSYSSTAPSQQNNINTNNNNNINTHNKTSTSTSTNTNTNTDQTPYKTRKGRKGAQLYQELNEAIRLVPLALQAVYEESPSECQRVAASQNWVTIYSCNESAAEKPAYALFASIQPAATDNVHQTISSQSQTSRNNNNNNTTSANNNNTNNNTTNTIKKEVVLAIRGTYSIHDLVTDIRAAPHKFPPSEVDINDALNGLYRYKDPEASYGAAQRIQIDIQTNNNTTNNTNTKNNNNNINNMTENSAVLMSEIIDTSEFISYNDTDNNNTDNNNTDNNATTSSTEEDLDFIPVSVSQWEWTADMTSETYACRGMAVSALWVLTQVAPSLITLYEQGYDIILTGHSLGAGVAALVIEMLKIKIPNIRGVLFGCPNCVDMRTADRLKNNIISIILHDDFISRVTPKTIRLLMNDLFIFRSQVFRHVQQDWNDVIHRAATLWSPRWREAHSIYPRNNNQRNNKSYQQQQLSYMSDNTTTIETNSSNSKKSKTNDNNTTTTTISNTSTPTKNDNNDDTTNNNNNVDDDDESKAWYVSDEAIADLWLPGRLIHIYSYHGQYHISEVDRNFPTLRRIEIQG